ncbi:hypothetical protein [Streptomyces yaizuensis]|uniref:Translation initiation factor IF-2 n=1 Tax=Streptomyces yaizuensis TaxID=2989713 RepID=A0ABQ5P514_9ACTN|nr:hypothetical protein [Streptomyces sp. YSPA8]GLF97553.1 hypothetical protein SYYSPA8_24670 [Streptomyces sp. YSPA8]
MGRERETGMAEGEGAGRGAMSAPSPSPPSGALPASDAPGDATHGVPPGASSDGIPPDAPPDDLPGLLALLGRLLEGHAPAEVAVLLREELDRRETAAYASGWRDAAAEYGAALDEALAATRSRPLRLVGQAPGRAAVLPFRQEFPPGAERRPGHPDRGDSRTAAAATDDGKGARSDKGDKGDKGDRGGSGGTAAPDGGPRAGDSRPALVPKRRGSRVPTIPRLAGPRRPRSEDPPDPPGPPDPPDPPGPTGPADPTGPAGPDGDAG